MARTLDGSTQWLDAAFTGNPLVLPSFTLSCWFYPPAIPPGANHTLMWWGDCLYASRYYELRINAAGQLELYVVRDAATATVTCVPVMAADKWHHACAVEHNLATRDLYLDGGNVASDATAMPSQTNNLIALGRNGSTTPRNYLSGKLAHAALFDTDLAAKHVASLASGESHRRIAVAAATNLRAYWPLNGCTPERNVIRNPYLQNMAMLVHGAMMVSEEPQPCRETVVEPGEPPPAMAYFPLSLCMEFDGVNDWVDFGHFAEANIAANQSKTIAFWFRATPRAGVQRLMSKYDATANKGWLLYLNDNTVGFVLRTAVAGNNWIGRVTNTAYADARWHLIVVTLDGSGTNAGLHIYVDNVEPASTTSGVGVTGDPTTVRPLYVGEIWNGAVGRYRDRACHSAVIEGEISAADRTALFSLGLPVQLGDVIAPANIVHWCTLGDGCALGAGGCPDLSPLGNNGTMTNMAAIAFKYDVPPTPASAPFSPITESVLFQSDAADEYVAHPVAVGNSLEKTDHFTIGGWVKTTDPAAGWWPFYGRYNSTTFLDNIQRGYKVSHSQGSLQLSLNTEDGAANRSFKTAATPAALVNDGSWHFFAFTSDGAANPNIACQIDGTYYFPADLTTTGGALINGTMVHATVPLTTGRGDVSFYRYWPGNLCHLFIYLGKDVDRYDLYRMWDEGTVQNLDAISNRGYLSFWSTYGNGCSIGAGGIIERIAANNGTPVNMEAGDIVADAP